MSVNLEESKWSALDVVEWAGTFRIEFDQCATRGDTDGMEAVERLWDAMWTGHGGAHSLRWYQMLGAPKEDGRKVLYCEAPYEDLGVWARAQAKAEELLDYAPPARKPE